MSEEEKGKKSWYQTKRNWGFWLLIVGFVAFLVTWFIIRPSLGLGG